MLLLISYGFPIISFSLRSLTTHQDVCGVWRPATNATGGLISPGLLRRIAFSVKPEAHFCRGNMRMS